jgi:hypothetical protein
LELTIDASPQLRGSLGTFAVSVRDHRNVNVDFVEGNFDLSFNGSWFNTTTNSTAKLISSLPLDANLVAGDYPLEVSFNGSTFYAPSVGTGTIRIRAGIDWTFNLAQDWTHIGNSTFINGSIFDDLYGTPILDQNITQYTISMVSPNGDVDIAQGLVDNNTSAFSQQILMPTNFASSVYSFSISFDFYSLGPLGGPYYSSAESYLDIVTGNITQQPSPSLQAGIESELVLNVISDRDSDDGNIVVTNGQFDFSILVTDVADNSFVPNEDVEFIFDWNGTNQSIGTARSDENGTANFSWNAIGIAPGLYDIRVVAFDNVSSPLSKGSTRHLGNFTLMNLTVQGNTDFRIDSIPSSITAGLDFNVIGQVIDADDNSRLLISPVKLEVFWLNNPNETLVTGYLTTTNGSFNMTVPTDVLNNGTVRGDKTLVISVIEESSPFYLESSLETPIFVFGVSEFDSLKPLNPIIVNRGDDVNLSGQLVESSNRFQPLSGYDVAVQLGDTWIDNLQTNKTGLFDLS